jgi:hypothetical protein
MDLIDTPLFVRMTPAEWWNYPLWVAGAVLVGLRAVTYVADPGWESAGTSHGGKIFGGGLLSVFALGASGALAYFGPLQRVLGRFTLGLLLYARLAGERSCPVDALES